MQTSGIILPDANIWMMTEIFLTNYKYYSCIPICKANIFKYFHIKGIQTQKTVIKLHVFARNHNILSKILDKPMNRIDLKENP